MNRHTVGAVPMGRAQTALILPCLVSIDLGSILRPRREASSERPEKPVFVGYPASVARSRASKLSSCASIRCLSRSGMIVFGSPQLVERTRIQKTRDQSRATISRELQASPYSSTNRRSILRSMDATSPLTVQTCLESEAFEACTPSWRLFASQDHQLAARRSYPALRSET